MMSKKELELYLHIPFCAKKCAYCDFLSFPAPAGLQMDYVNKLTEEISAKSALYQEYEVISIFIGGGTPSVLPAQCIAKLMESLHMACRVRHDAEITIEVNPGTVTMDKLKAYREAGVNRISLGLQSADDEELRSLGRIHTYDDFLKTYQRVRMTGFYNVNVDLMSGIPGQTMATWERTLKKVLMLKPEHISAYSLIVEKGTPFYDFYGRGSVPGVKPLPDEDTEREMYRITKRYLKEHGYGRYEISNYAKPGYECRHNVGYWTGVDYSGLGLGASSYMRGYRFHNEADLGEYLKIPMNTDEDSKLRQELEQLDLKDKMEEFMFLGLRMMAGVSGSDFVARFGQNMWSIYGNIISRLEKQGLLEVEMPRIKLTDRGIDLSNYVMSQFLLDS